MQNTEPQNGIESSIRHGQLLDGRSFESDVRDIARLGFTARDFDHLRGDVDGPDMVRVGRMAECGRHGPAAELQDRHIGAQIIARDPKFSLVGIPIGNGLLRIAFRDLIPKPAWLAHHRPRPSNWVIVSPQSSACPCSRKPVRFGIPARRFSCTRLDKVRRRSKLRRQCNLEGGLR